MTDTTTQTKTLKRTEDEALKSVLDTTLRVSQMVYQYANLRQVVRKHDERYAPSNSKDTLVQLNTPAHIVTQNCDARGIHNFQSTFLKHEITAPAILQFMRDNEDYLGVSGGNIVFKDPSEDNDTAALNKIESLESIVEQLGSHHDADIVEFDDEFADKSLRSELVFSVIVNRSEKRVTVVFRGSVSFKDWLIDGLGIVSRTQPKIVKDFTERGVKFHGGFSKYLFGKSRIKGKDATKFDEIIDILREIYEYKNEENGRDYSDYELFITGHSLGGGLTQLLAFTLARMKDELTFLPKDKPITAISYASPEAGNRKFENEFSGLEKEGKLRHIRVSNNGDAVTIVFKHMFYKQTGLNIHVYDQEDKRHTAVGYNSAIGFWINPFKALSMHNLLTYFSRLFTQENDDILQQGIETLYQKYAGFSRLESIMHGY